MWAMIKYLVTQIALFRWIFGSLGSLGILIPVLMVLKAIGLPVLMVIAVIALPVLLLLLLIGLPIFLVLICGGILLAIAWAFLTVGAVVLKPLILVLLPMFVIGYGMWWLFSGRKRGGGEKPA